jgi:hypothetical protein
MDVRRSTLYLTLKMYCTGALQKELRRRLHVLRQNQVSSVRTHTSVIGIVTGYRLDDLGKGVRFPARGWEFFPSPSRPDRLWGPPSLVSNGYRELFARG